MLKTKQNTRRKAEAGDGQSLEWHREASSCPQQADISEPNQGHLCIPQITVDHSPPCQLPIEVGG